MSKSTNLTGYKWALVVAIGITVLANIPFVLGYSIAPPGYKYLGFTYTVDDACVYLSWMRQAADGHFFLQNLFTTEPQNGNGFNLFFLFLGNLARLTHIPLTAMFHLSRIVFGIALLMAIYAFFGIWLKEERSRKIAFLVVGLSSGLGWMLASRFGDNNPAMDTWQPEAITFLSVYLSPLYTFPTLLMLGSIYFLHRFAETRAWKYAVYAGLVLLFLSNIHTYDIITIAFIWAFYSLYKLIAKPHDPYPALGGLVVALIAVPLAAYQLYFYYTEPIFRDRAAVPTPSPQFRYYMVGYGLLVPLALVGIWKWLRARKDIALLLCWLVAGFVCAYLPLTFQRKLLMSTHIPLSLLAAVGLIAIADKIRPVGRNAFVAAVIIFMMTSNVYFIGRDCVMLMSNLSGTMAHVPLISDQELGALKYLREHSGPRDVVLATPGIAVLVPGYTGARVYSGHWGETVDFEHKVWETVAFYSPYTDNSQRKAYLKSKNITYVISYHNHDGMNTDVQDFREHPAPFLNPVYDTNEVSVYRVIRKLL